MNNTKVIDLDAALDEIVKQLDSSKEPFINGFDLAEEKTITMKCDMGCDASGIPHVRGCSLWEEL